MGELELFIPFPLPPVATVGVAGEPVLRGVLDGLAIIIPLVLAFPEP